MLLGDVGKCELELVRYESACIGGFLRTYTGNGPSVVIPDSNAALVAGHADELAVDLPLAHDVSIFSNSLSTESVGVDFRKMRRALVGGI